MRCIETWLIFLIEQKQTMINNNMRCIETSMYDFSRLYRLVINNNMRCIETHWRVSDALRFTDDK